MIVIVDRECGQDYQETIENLTENFNSNFNVSNMGLKL